MTDATHLTAETHARLVAELEDLTTRGVRDRAVRSRLPVHSGDLSENGDYHAAKDAQGKMESRVRQLQRMLEDAVIVDTSTHEAGVVTTGVVVELRYGGDEGTEKFLVGSIEEKGRAFLSSRPPLRSARRCGTQRGRDRRVPSPERPAVHCRDRLGGQPVAVASTLAEKVLGRSRRSPR